MRLRCHPKCGPSQRCRRLFEDGVVAVGEQALADDVGIAVRGEWADLNVQKMVLRLLAHEDSVAALLERGEQQLCILLMGDGCHLDDRGSVGGRGGKRSLCRRGGVR